MLSAKLCGSVEATARTTFYCAQKMKPRVLTTTCDRCGVHGGKLFAIYAGGRYLCVGLESCRRETVEATHSAHFVYCFPSRFRSRTKVCGSCLVGEFIPVFRASLGRWRFGQVLALRSVESDCQFCLLFGTFGADREWVDVSPKPLDSYVRYCRTGTTKIAGSLKSIDELAYDDTPIPLGISGANNKQRRTSFPLPLTPIQTARHASRLAYKLAGPGLIQSSGSAPYYQRDFVTLARNDHREAVSQPPSRLWTIDVSFQKL